MWSFVASLHPIIAESVCVCVVLCLHLCADLTSQVGESTEQDLLVSKHEKTCQRRWYHQLHTHILSLPPAQDFHFKVLNCSRQQILAYWGTAKLFHIFVTSLNFCDTKPFLSWAYVGHFISNQIKIVEWISSSLCARHQTQTVFFFHWFVLDCNILGAGVAWR